MVDQSPCQRDTGGALPQDALIGLLRSNTFATVSIARPPRKVLACRLGLAATVVSKAGTGRNEAADDDVFLETTQLVALAHDGSLGKNARRFLEGSGRNERIGRQRGLGNAQQHVSNVAGSLPSAIDAVIFAQELGTFHLFGLDELGITRLDDGNRRSIWRTMTSMCLSLIFTPCRR
jgi:hypothetical protein